MKLGTHTSLQGAARAYTDAYDPLFIWIKNELWKTPKNGQVSDKARLQEMHDRLLDLSRGKAKAINPGDFDGIEGILQSAAFDAARDHSVAYAGLPPQRQIDSYILEARDDLLRDVVNAAYAAPTPAAAAALTKQKLNEAATGFLTRQEPLINSVVAVLSHQGLASLTDQYLEPFMRGVKIIGGFPSRNHFTHAHVQSLEEGDKVLRIVAMAADKLTHPPIPGNVIIDLEKAADDYRDSVLPVIGEMKQHGGIAKQFGATRSP